MNHIELHVGQVTSKHINTANDFISHMLEHIAWRMGCSIQLEWDNKNWQELGRALAAEIKKFVPLQREAATLGMIDDGSAEVGVELVETAELNLDAAEGIDLDYFLSLRCEQLASGQPLIELLLGLTLGIGARITILVGSLNDPHHTWEGIFRGLGTALSKLYVVPAEKVAFSTTIHEAKKHEGVQLHWSSCQGAEIERETAESKLLVSIDYNAQPGASFSYLGTPIEHYDAAALDGLHSLLKRIATECGFHLRIIFTAKALSSSHVLLEDTGMVLGRVLREILVQRMMDQGINGAGSSLQVPSDIRQQALSVGISVEGRKSCLFVPFTTDKSLLYRDFILGHTVFGGLYSEDLDDFFDGFSWGLGCSIIIHCKEKLSPEAGWGQLFSHFGSALREVLLPNPSRRGVPPGVKANLF
ncbi:hypothetical protein [Desulfogranum marinum]|uniref:hypothetical protein n=1 Tax=Desulfogranum marinum TaxID=453220 RepID=UPI001962390E|nr:hypothetical protein [Desulfogranum marinum]MBM9511044.1 hypothetical protein [Desulfogranum marinum]